MSERQVKLQKKFKIVSLGESGVGKSSLVLKFVKGQFHELPMPTIGAAFLTKKVALEENQVVMFDIWDTAGQERFHSILPLYYRGAHAAIVVYDITKMDTFLRAKDWVEELQRYASKDIVLTLIGNKVDLTADRMVKYDAAAAFAEANEMIFFESSAKSNINVNNIFETIADKLKKKGVDAEDSTRGRIRLHQRSKRRNKCCS